MLGQFGRGHDADIGAKQAEEMKRTIDLRVRFDARLLHHPEELPFDEEAAPLIVTQAASELFLQDKWISVLDEAITEESTIKLTKGH